jgi:hypothetical protein
MSVLWTAYARRGRQFFRVNARHQPSPPYIDLSLVAF